MKPLPQENKCSIGFDWFHFIQEYKYHIAINKPHLIPYRLYPLYCNTYTDNKMKLIRAALILLHVVCTYGQGQEGVDSEDIKIDDDEDGRVLGKAGGKAPKFKKDACQRRVDKLEARLMKLEAALAGGEEEKAEEEGEEEDSGNMSPMMDFLHEIT